MIVCSVLLIPCELVTELGVEASQQCTPVQMYGEVISSKDASDNFTSNELAGMSYLIQSTDFVDGKFDSVQAGIPRKISGMECISCLKGNRNPNVVAGCSIKMDRIYRAGELKLTIRTTNTSFKTITTSFNETSGARKVYDAQGDVTRNGKHWASIMFQRNGRSLQYLEYTAQEHLQSMFNEAVGTLKDVTSSTKSDTRLYSISCKTNVLSDRHFDDAVAMYRIIQLENPVSVTRYIDEEERFVDITPDVIYRAVLAMKIVDDEFDNKNYFLYTSCGKYQTRFLLPLLSCIAVILALGVFSVFGSRRSKMKHKIPHTSRSWLKYVNENQDQGSRGWIDIKRSEGNMDEMVVVEEGHGLRKTRSVVLVDSSGGTVRSEEDEFDSGSLDDDLSEKKTGKSDSTRRIIGNLRNGQWKGSCDTSSSGTINDIEDVPI